VCNCTPLYFFANSYEPECGRRGQQYSYGVEKPPGTVSDQNGDAGTLISVQSAHWTTDRTSIDRGTANQEFLL
jgi:hypothetical protein